MMNFNNLAAIFVAGASLVALAASAVAAPQAVTYSGELRAANGLPYDGDVDVSVEFFASMMGADSLGAAVATTTTVTEGVFEVTLMDGEVAPFSATDTVWAEFTIDGEVLSPRQRIVAVPYALEAGDANTLGGMAAGEFVAAGEPLANNTLQPDAISAASNGALTNTFMNVQLADTAGKPIIDFPGPATGASLVAAEGPGSILTSLTVQVGYELTFSSELRIRLFPPNGATPIVLFEGPVGNGEFTSVWDDASSPMLNALLGGDVSGQWDLEIADLDDDAAEGTQVGTLTQFAISYDVIRADYLVVSGQLDADDLTVTGNAMVQGNLMVGGALITSTPRESCNAIQGAGESQGNGYYRIWPNNDAASGAKSVMVYCEMETRGGGWTRIAEGLNPGGVAEYNPLAVDDKGIDYEQIWISTADSKLNTYAVNVAQWHWAGWAFRRNTLQMDNGQFYADLTSGQDDGAADYSPVDFSSWITAVWGPVAVCYDGGTNVPFALDNCATDFIIQPPSTLKLQAIHDIEAATDGADLNNMMATAYHIYVR